MIFKRSKNKKNNDVYVLCFKDFNTDKLKRKPCRFLKVVNNTLDSQTDIAKKFKGISIGTKLFRKLGVNDGLWGLVAISKEEDIYTLDYDSINDF